MASIEERRERIREIKWRLDEISVSGEHLSDGGLVLDPEARREFKELLAEATQAREDIAAAELMRELQAEHDRIVDAALLSGGRTYTQADADRLAELDAEAELLREQVAYREETRRVVAAAEIEAREARRARSTFEAARADEERARAALLDARRTFILAWRRRQRRKLFHLTLTLPSGLLALGYLATSPPAVWVLTGLVLVFVGIPLSGALRPWWRWLRRRRATLAKANAAHAAFLGRRAAWRNAWDLRMRAEADLPLHVLYPEIFVDVWADSRR